MILDTNALSALIAKDAALLRVLGDHALSIPVIVLGEYRYGLLQSRERVLIARWLEKKGRPIPANDVWIAALTRQHAHPLVSRDGHFDHVSSIERVIW